MRTHQTIRRFFSVLITVSMFLTCIPIAKLVIADNEPTIYYIFDRTPNIDNDNEFAIYETADDPGDDSSWVAMYIDGANGTANAFDATGLDPRTQLILNNAKVENASIYQDFILLGTSRIDYEGWNAYTSSESEYSFGGFTPDDAAQTMAAYQSFMQANYDSKIGPTIVTHITGSQTLNMPMDYSYLVIDPNGTLTIQRLDGPEFDHLCLRIWNDLTVYGSLVFAPASGNPDSLEFMDGATLVIDENANLSFAEGTVLSVHSRMDNLDIDPGEYMWDPTENNFVPAQYERAEGIYLRQDDQNPCFASATYTIGGTTYTMPDDRIIRKEDFENADSVTITFTPQENTSLTFAVRGDQGGWVNPAFYTIEGNTVTLTKPQEGWLPIYEIDAYALGIYLMQNNEDPAFSSASYVAGEGPDAVSETVSNGFIPRDVFADKDQITITFTKMDPDRALTIDVRDEIGRDFDSSRYNFDRENSILTICKDNSEGAEWELFFEVQVGVDHSGDPRVDGIYIGSPMFNLFSGASYVAKAGDDEIATGTVDQQGFIERSVYDNADSIEITLAYGAPFVIEVFDDADPRERISTDLYSFDGTVLTIYKGQGEGAQWFSSYEVQLVPYGIHFYYDHQQPPIRGAEYSAGGNSGDVSDNYIAKSVYEDAEFITITFDIVDTERDLTIDVRDENDQLIDRDSGVYTYENGILTINKGSASDWPTVYNIGIGVDHSNDPREPGIYIHQDENNPVFSAGSISFFSDSSNPYYADFQRGAFIAKSEFEDAYGFQLVFAPMEGARDVEYTVDFFNENNELIFQTVEKAGMWFTFWIFEGEEWENIYDIYVREYLGEGMNITYDPGEVAITFEINENGDVRGLMGDNICAEDLQSADTLDLYFSPIQGYIVSYANYSGSSYSTSYENTSITHIHIDRPEEGWGKKLNLEITTEPEGQVIPNEQFRIIVERDGPGDVRIANENLVVAKTSTGKKREYYFRPQDQYDIVLEAVPNSEGHCVTRRFSINGYQIKPDQPDQVFQYSFGDFLRNYWKSGVKAGDAYALDAEFYDLDNIAVLEGFKVRLADSISVDYYISIPDEIAAEYPTVTFELNSASGMYKKQEVSYWDCECRKEGGKWYYVYTCDVCSADLTQPITATLKGEMVEVTFPTFTVRDYAMHFVNDDPNDETSNLAKALLNYGYYSQKKFAPNTDIFEEDNIGVPTVTIGKIGDFTQNLPAGVTYKGSTVTFLAGSMIKHYFIIDPGTEVNFYIDGNRVEPVAASGGQVYIATDVINILDAGKDIRVTIECNNTNYETDFAVLDYIYAVLRNSKGNMSQDMLNLAAAFYMYYDASINYTA
ncbi:MAG: hypothetical protein IKX68_06410 [Clostridiales bacterium]|nr:hypothetical protein [Clostridiales bacterium]